MIQLTEKEARELIENLYYKSDVTSFVDENLSVKQWKEKGFIKKSKLEEARAKISNIKLNVVESRIVDLYEEAIKEILEDKNADK